MNKLEFIEKVKLLNIKISDVQAENFFIYMKSLLEWNKKMNLTAITNEDEVILKHFIDSLTINKYMNGKKVMDIGTGAGFPSIPLKIVNKDIPFILVDSLNKRINFLDEVRRKTVFTTHTPVAAGNEVHWVDTLLEGGFFAGASRERALQLGGENFSLTVAALRMSRIANAVSQLHGLVANKMWEWVDGRCPIRAITNAVNLHYWQDKRMNGDKSFDELLAAKREMKEELFKYMEKNEIKIIDFIILENKNIRKNIEI